MEGSRTGLAESFVVDAASGPSGTLPFLPLEGKLRNDSRRQALDHRDADLAFLGSVIYFFFYVFFGQLTSRGQGSDQHFRKSRAFFKKNQLARASKAKLAASASAMASDDYETMAESRSVQGLGQGASTTSSDILFEEVIPVHVKEFDKQERVEHLGFRISLCTTQAGHNMVKVEKVLKLQLTSEKDSFFLHSLEVTEDSFQRLKHDQSILVDFTDFPAHLIELLESCIQAKQEAQPKFLCVLSTSKPVAADQGSASPSGSPVGAGGAPGAALRLSSVGDDSATSVVGIVETNQFKHLCHISMKFQPGNDARIKDYLSQRLSEVRAARMDLETRLSAEEAASAELRADLSQAKLDLGAEQAARKEQDSRFETERQGLLTGCKQELLSEVAGVRDGHDREKRALEAAHKEERDTLSSANASLTRRVTDLQDEKFALDAKSRELAVKVESLEGELRLLRESEQELKQSNLDLDSGKHGAEKQVNLLMLKLAGLEATMKEKDSLIGTLKTQLQSGEQSSGALQESFAEMKQALQRAEERSALSAQEVSKGNHIIEKLQQDLKSSRAKMKLKSQVIAQQENLLQEKQQAIDKLERDGMVAKSQAQGLEAEKSALGRTCDDQRDKLAESKKLLDQNQQMIQWLNNQINEAQIAKYGGTSRFAFRPTRKLGNPPASAES